MPKQATRDGVFQRKDTAGWYVSFVDADGVRRKKRVVAHTRTQATTILSEMKARVQKERVLGVKHTSDMTTAELLAKFKKYQKARLQPTTFERLAGIINTLVAHLPERLRDISRQSVASFISSRAATAAPATIQKEMATLKHALRLAVEWELIHANPATGAKLPRIPEGRTRYLSPAELKNVLKAAPDWMRAPIALAAFTGMRRGELLGLRWRDIDLPGRRAYLHETKNGSLRVVSLNDLAMKIIDSLPVGQPGDLVLSDVDGEKLTVYTVRLFKSLGIEDASFHSLRHTAGSWLAMAGVDLYAVGQILGHRTPRMTQRYAHLSPQYLSAASNKLNGVFGDVLPLEKGGTPTGLTHIQNLTSGS